MTLSLVDPPDDPAVYDYTCESDAFPQGPPPIVGKVATVLALGWSVGTMITVDIPGQLLTIPEGARVQITVLP